MRIKFSLPFQPNMLLQKDDLLRLENKDYRVIDVKTDFKSYLKVEISPVIYDEEEYFLNMSRSDFLYGKRFDYKKCPYFINQVGDMSD